MRICARPRSVGSSGPSETPEGPLRNWGAFGRLTGASEQPPEPRAVKWGKAGKNGPKKTSKSEPHHLRRTDRKVRVLRTGDSDKRDAGVTNIIGWLVMRAAASRPRGGASRRRCAALRAALLLECLIFIGPRITNSHLAGVTNIIE